MTPELDKQVARIRELLGNVTVMQRDLDGYFIFVRDGHSYFVSSPRCDLPPTVDDYEFDMQTRNAMPALLEELQKLGRELQQAKFKSDYDDKRIRELEAENGALTAMFELRSIEHDQCHHDADELDKRVVQLEAEIASMKEQFR